MEKLFFHNKINSYCCLINGTLVTSDNKYSFDYSYSYIVQCSLGWLIGPPKNRGRTYSTHHEVLVLVLGVETEPNLLVVL